MCMGFFWFYFVNEQVLRYLNQRVPRDYDTVPLVLFWGLLAVWLMPWIAFVFHAMGPIRMRSSARRLRLPRHSQAWNLLGVWAGFVMLFFSFSHTAGILRAACLAADRADDWWMAETGRDLPCALPRPHRRAAHRCYPLRFGFRWVVRRWVSCSARAAPGTRCGHFYVAQPKPGRLCAFTWPCFLIWVYAPWGFSAGR